MNAKTESVIDVLAALLVLFTAMIDTRISIILAVSFLVMLSIYKYYEDSNRKGVRSKKGM